MNHPVFLVILITLSILLVYLGENRMTNGSRLRGTALLSFGIALLMSSSLLLIRSFF